MKLFWTPMYTQSNPGYWMFTASIIILAGFGIYPFLRWKSQYTAAVKREHLRFILKGLLPFLITAWIGGSEIGYTKEFLGAACYSAGFSSVFFVDIYKYFCVTFLRCLIILVQNINYKSFAK